MTVNGRPEDRTGGIRWARISLLIAGVIILFTAGRMISDMLVSEVRVDLAAGNEQLLHRAIMTASTTYIVLMAVPFMPGAEIGLGMLMVFGGKISFLVYVSTVASLSIGFALGRILPSRCAASVFGMLGLKRACEFTLRLAPLRPSERLDLLLQGSRSRWAVFLIRHRYVLLALALNVPGNIVIGGGGGIAVLAGMTRLFSPPLYLLTVAVATAPVPLAVYVSA